MAGNPNQFQQWGELDQYGALRDQVARPLMNGYQAMSQWGQGQLDAASQSWVGFKRDHPVPALIASMAPVTGQITAAADLYDAGQRGNGLDAALAAAQFIPFGGAVKGIKAARQLSGTAAQVAAAKAAGAAAVQAGNVADYVRGAP